MRTLKDNAPVLVIAAVTIIVFVGILLFASRTEQKTDVGSSVDQARFMTEGTHVRGEASASATLVEFSDFECPACGMFYPKISELEHKYPTSLKVVYKHFPLPQHTEARKAAEAAEAAGAQGKFWEMHDKMFENQKALKVEDLKKYAADLGLDTKKFDEELDSGKYAAKVQTDSALGTGLGVNSTPTFYLNGKKIVNLKSLNSLEDEIRKELKL